MNVYKRISVILTVLMIVLFIPATAFASSDEADDITCSVDADEEIEFDEDDFNDACQELYDEDLNYVKFDLPSSSKGTLYYDYDGDDEDEVDEDDKYYYDDSPGISEVTFVPEEDYSGTVSIDYTGRDEDGNKFTGVIKIKVKEPDDDDDTADDIEYSCYSDETVKFSKEDFNEVCNDVNDEDLDCVKFTLPSSSYGVLYYNYSSASVPGSKISASNEYYYDDDDFPSLSYVTFVPNEDYSGTVTIEYKGYDEDDDSFSGEIAITIVAKESKEISYSVNSDEEITFDEDDFNDLCNDLNNEDLFYVRFKLPSSSYGELYYDYDDGDYNSKVSSSKKYYYDDNLPYLSNITFVPNINFSGVCEIDFVGYDDDEDTFNGTLKIIVTGEELTADKIKYSTTAGSSVIFSEDDFDNACEDLTGNSLDYVKFTLPSSLSGTLYYEYTSGSSYTSKVSASAKYYSSETPYLNQVAFVPISEPSGTSAISYTGYDTEGRAFTGEVEITYTTASDSSAGNTETLKKSQYFGDVTEAYSWAVDYIDGLYDTGVVTGSTDADSTAKLFHPSYNITRGDFVLLLYRTLNLKSDSAAENFSDVTAGSYYYDAIAAAKALGIAQGTDNYFYPDATITREDAMVLALRAMNAGGSTVTAGSTGDLSAYSDQAQISDYASEAIASLIKAGIITGNTDGKIYPKSSITRAEAAAIIYRIKN